MILCDWSGHSDWPNNTPSYPKNKKIKKTATLSTKALLTTGTLTDVDNFGCFMSLSNHNVFFIDFSV